MNNDGKATRLRFLHAAFFGLIAFALLGIGAYPVAASGAIFLHGSSSTPPALYLDTIAPNAPAPKFLDSAGVAFSGGNAWKEIGTWTPAPTVVTGTVGNLRAYVGLKNSDDQGTQFDVRVELYKNGALVGSGQTNCIPGVTRNPDQAKEIAVSLNSSGDIDTVKVLTRIGTTGTGTFCGGHSSATGLRFYFDGVSRPSQLAGQGPAPLSTPNLLGVFAAGKVSGTAYVVGRVDSITTPTALTLQAATCGSTGVDLGPSPTTTDKYGFFFFQVNNANLQLGRQVKVAVTAPQATAASNCVIESSDNDYWPKALSLDGSLTAQDYIDIPGRGRWYKFTIQPSQSVRIKLSGLPADYDLAVFKDIKQAFKGVLAPNTSAELLKLSAEFAPSVSQSIFSQSIFSQSIFSQSIFSQSIFSQSIFSQSIFSQSIFSQSIFSQSIFSTDCDPTSGYCYFKGLDAGGTVDQIAQAYSAAQVQSLVGVSATPGTADELVVLNTWNNTGEYYIRVSGRNGAFDPVQPFTITVTPDAKKPCEGVTPQPPRTNPLTAKSGVSVFVTDSSLLDLGASVPVLDDPQVTETLLTKLTRFNQRPDVNGPLVEINRALVDVGDSTGVYIDPESYQRIKALKKQATIDHPSCPYAKNLLAQEIKSVIDTYSPGTYVVILGNDATVPFFRDPDGTPLGQEFNYVPPLKPDSPSDASLRGNYVLSQDAYGASKSLATANGDYWIPERAVGRLVETPAEIAVMLNAYVATNGVVTPNSGLVTGYDFLADAATEVASQLRAGMPTGSTVDTLITNSGVPPSASWTADDLRSQLLGPVRHHVVYLAGHFSANNALAADFTSTIVTTELKSATNLKNSLVFSAGCHSGYNIVDSDGIPLVTEDLDWAQAFNGKGVTLVAGTGYQYGDTDFLEYSERLYANFSRQLRTGTGNVAVGDALVKAKQVYLADTPDIRGIHEKVLLESTLFGLPMLGVNMTGARLPASTPPIGVTPIAVATDLATCKLSFQDGSTSGGNCGNMVVPMTLKAQSKVLTNLAGGASITAEWFSGQNDSDVVTNPVQPTLPLVTADVTPPAATGLVLRGVGFLGGNYGTDKLDMYPLTGAPTTESSNVHLAFEPPVFYPNVMWTPNYFGALTGAGGTSLQITPVQHKGYDVLKGTSVQRKFSQLDLKLYYSSRTGPTAAATSAGATIASVNATSDGADGVVFSAQVLGDPSAGIQDVWVTYNKDPGVWASLPLANCVAPLPPACGTSTDSRMWAASLPSVSQLRYVVQAATKTGMVSLDSNQGAYYLYGIASPAVSTLQIVSAPSSATFGTAVPVSAKLTSNGSGAANKAVLISLGSGGVVGVTQSDGTVKVKQSDGSFVLPNLPVIGVVPGPNQMTVSFFGDDSLLPVSATSAITVLKAPTALASASVASPSIGATLTSGGQPLPQRSVKFTFVGTRGQNPQSVVAFTNNDGTAIISATPADLIPDTYTVTLQFPATGTNSDPAYNPSTLMLSSGNYVVPKHDQTVTVGTVPNNTSFTFGDPPFPVSASASSGLPVSFSATGGACSVSPTTVNNATVQIVGGGNCTITANQTAAGSLDYNPAPPVDLLSVTVAKAAQTITFAQPATPAVYNSSFTVGATSDSGLSVTIAATGVCSVNGSSVTMTSGTGTCTLTASQGGNNNYLPATSVVRAVAAAPATQTITFAPPPSPAAYSSTFAVSASSSIAGLSVAIAASGACSISGSNVTMTSGTGTCTLTASQGGDGNYLPATSVVRTVAATPATQTITFAPPPSPAAYNSTFAVSASSSAAGLSVAIAASGACSISGGNVTMTSGTGACTLTASQPGNTNYGPAANVIRTVDAALATQTIAAPMVITPSAPAFVLNGTFTVSTTASSGLPVAYTSLTTGTCTIATGTNVVKMLGAGLCTIVADQIGNGNYKAAERLTQSVTIGQTSQTISFANPGDKTLATPTFALIATASSGLPVSFAAAGSCSVSGTTLTLTATGSCTVTASQAGNTDYAPAPNVAQTFAIDLANVWTLLTAKMTKPRLFHTATRLADGKVLIAGGIDRTGTRHKNSEIYNPATRTFTAVASSMLSGASDHAAALLLSGKVLVVGGGSSSAQLFDPAAPGTWSSAGTPASSLTPNRSNHTATVLPDGKVLFVGGADSSGITLKTTIVYTPPVAPATTGTFAAGPTLDVARERHTATSLPDGKVLIAGGRAKSGSSYTTHATAQICSATACTPSSGSIGNRHSHAAVALGPDGSKVLVAGGANGSTALATVALYTYNATTGTGAWTTSGLVSLATTRSELTLSELPNGRGLAAGGIKGNSVVKAADVYQPPFASAASMNVARAGHTATVLKNAAGNITGILVAGGGEDDADEDDALDKAEIYGTP